MCIRDSQKALHFGWNITVSVCIGKQYVVVRDGLAAGVDAQRLLIQLGNDGLYLSLIHILDELQAQEGKDIWICGGAQIIRTLMEDDRIDVYQLTIVPVLLGAGIPLFERLMDPCRLRLIETTVQGDVVELRYGRSFHICRMQHSQLERVA